MNGLHDGQKSRVHDGFLYSPSLRREKAYRVLLPDEHVAASGRLPVLYLLHGYDCNFTTWDTCTHLQQYAQNLPIMIVLPDGENSWYVNSAVFAEDKFEDYIVQDVIADVDSRYATIADRSGRAIAGMSSGGYGAIRLALDHPELFSFAGSLGGTLAPDTYWNARRAPAFGSPERVQPDGHCLFSLLQLRRPNPGPKFYLACGTEDWWLDANRRFVQQLASRNMCYEYSETAGGHTWDYWDRALEPMLLAAARAISPAKKKYTLYQAFSRLQQQLSSRLALGGGRTITSGRRPRMI